MTEGTKIAIVGAGRVGSTLAYTLAASGLARQIVLIDSDRNRAEGEAMDIAHAATFRTPVSIGAADLDGVADAAITVIAAGAAQRPGEGRPALMQRNAALLRDIVPDVVRMNPQGLLLIATNPVDALTFSALKLSGLPASRVFGSGTVLDTARLRSELAAHYGIDGRNVHAYVLGEHGDSEFVAWSTASLANVELEKFCGLTGMCCNGQKMVEIEARVRNAAYEIIRRKGATNFAIAASLTRIIEAVVHDQASVLTVSALVEGHYGLRDVCLSLPAVVDRSGVRMVIPVPLSEEETASLVNSASAIRAMLANEAGGQEGQP